MDALQRILNVDVLTSHGNIPGRKAIVEILEAGLRAADPYSNALKLMRIDGRQLIIGHPDLILPDDPRQHDEVIDLDEIDRILVVGAGKGIQRAAKALEDVLGDHLTGGHVIDKHGSPLILERIGVTFGAHPVPDEGCVLGCQRILSLITGLTARDLVITLVGNGVSSLLTLPVEGVTLEDVRQTTHIMQIQRGAPTGDLNPVRNHLDQLKGGRLSRRLQPARAIHLLTGQVGSYDYAHNRSVWLHSMPDEGTFADAVAMLHKWDAWDAVPEAVRAHLLRADPAQETVRMDEFDTWRWRVYEAMQPHVSMLPMAQRKAQELGFATHTLYRLSHFEAAPGAIMSACIALNVENYGEPFEPPCALFGGHELLVTVGDEGGMGGRNQEWALSAATRIAGSQNIVMASVDSDGTDGPGHQFVEGLDELPVLDGGVVDGQTLDEVSALGYDVYAELRRHNTSPVLYAVDSGVEATPNISVNDLTVILILGRKG